MNTSSLIKKSSTQLALVSSVVIGFGLTTSPTMAAEFIFGFSGSNANSLTLQLSDNSIVTLTTDQSEFTPGSSNQGWWSAVVENDDANDNYIVGDSVGDGISLLNNFFTFDISGLSGTVVSATLNLQRFEGGSNLGNATQSYSLYDVSTDAAVLNFNSGTNGAIFNDLGSGTNYGNYSVTVAGDPEEILNFSLLSSAISDINNAISNGSEFFSIGGTLNPGGATVPEPASILGLLTVAGLGLSMKRKNRNI
jgi:hypothetical protein